MTCLRLFSSARSRRASGRRPAWAYALTSTPMTPGLRSDIETAFSKPESLPRVGTTNAVWPAVQCIGSSSRDKGDALHLDRLWPAHRALQLLKQSVLPRFLLAKQELGIRAQVIFLLRG